MDSPLLDVPTLIRGTFSATPNPATGGIVKVPNSIDKAADAKREDETSRDEIPLNTSATVQALVWGNGQAPPVPSGVPGQAPSAPGPVATGSATAGRPAPGAPSSATAPPAKTLSRGTAPNLDPVEKGWGKV